MKQLNLRYPSETVDAIREQAERNGETVSEYIYECAVANMDSDVADRVVARRRPGRPRKNDS